MLHSQLKINNQVIGLVLFMLVNLTSCNCGNNDNQDPSSPETSSDTSTGGTNIGTENTGQTNTGTENTGEQTTGQANTRTENTEVTTIGPEKTVEATTGAENTAPISITSQEIDQLLKEIEDSKNPIKAPERARLIKCLKKIRDGETLSTVYRQKFLLAAIKYNITAYNTIDILKLAIDKSKEVESKHATLKDAINTPYKNLTFLQYAAYYDNTDAIGLLLQKGAQKDFKTTVNVVLDGKNIPTGSTAYDIAAILNSKGAINKLKL